MSEMSGVKSVWQSGCRQKSGWYVMQASPSNQRKSVSLAVKKKEEEGERKNQEREKKQKQKRKSRRMSAHGRSPGAVLLHTAARGYGSAAHRCHALHVRAGAKRWRKRARRRERKRVAAFLFSSFVSDLFSLSLSDFASVRLCSPEDWTCRMYLRNVLWPPPVCHRRPFWRSVFLSLPLLC